MIDQDKMRTLAKRLSEVSAVYSKGQVADIHEAADAIDALLNRVSQLEAARIGYANEFPMDAEGLPNVGSIHENIRKLKAELEAAAADKRDQFARLLTIIEKDSEWADARAVDWTRGVLMATLKVALAQRQGEGS
ncbi:hypothetical protein [Burkholderia sp. BC1]|uniref:hypothetical protein n=1 Tax=Burkholderia sp. BC1 TaxID=1095370 RepID=UPI0040440FC7